MWPFVKIFAPRSSSNGRSESVHLRTGLFFRQIHFWGFSVGSGEKAKHSGSHPEDACVKGEVTSCRDQPGDRGTAEHRAGTPPSTDLTGEGRTEKGPPARSQQHTHTWGRPVTPETRLRSTGGLACGDEAMRRLRSQDGAKALNSSWRWGAATWEF